MDISKQTAAVPQPPSDPGQLEGDLFRIRLDPCGGGMNSLILNGDDAGMDWVKDGSTFFRPVMDPNYKGHGEFTYLGGSAHEGGYWEQYQNQTLYAETVYRIREDGALTVTVDFTNRTAGDAYFYRGLLGLTLPFNDSYPDADTCMTHRCNAHIWCGGSAYVLALKMGDSACGLGMLLTEGETDGYSQTSVRSNDRGVFILHPALRHLSAGGSYHMEFLFFPCQEKNDFLRQMVHRTDAVHIQARCYTVFQGEPIRFETSKKDCAVRLEGSPVSLRTPAIEYLPSRPGEHVFHISNGKWASRAVFNVVPPLDELSGARARFLVERQQCLDPGSPLYGAYLLYDNEENAPYYDEGFADHNVLRERVGSALFLTEYARKHPSKEILRSLALYEQFLRREAVDPETGDVFGSIGRQNNRRLYNFYWYAHFYAEYYALTGGRAYLETAYRIVRRYYALGGRKHYPNAAFPLSLIDALRTSGMAEQADELGGLLLEHAENMLKVGCSYPRHEVNFEQTIVAPACTILMDAYRYSGREKYRAAMETHLRVLDRFDGIQPDYHLNGIAIRFWDDFWFGKAGVMGDTLPHYWSVLSGIVYIQYGRLIGDSAWVERGENCLRNTLCLFKGTGEASCACVYPFRTNGVRGEFFDPWANDQDFALYYALLYLGGASGENGWI